MHASSEVSGDEKPRFVMTQFTVEEFFKFWPQLEVMLDSVPHTWRRLTKDHICQTIAGDLMQIWGIGRPPQATLILMTTVNVYPAMRVFSMVWAGGHMDDGMIDLIDSTFEGYARLNDCAEIALPCGRLGWDKLLKSRGFQREGVALFRPVAGDYSVN
jgi:hypothetical protein